MATKMQTPCDRCGLKAVRRELERAGVTYRFCDECYWGELNIEGRPAESGQPGSGTAAGGRTGGIK